MLSAHLTHCPLTVRPYVCECVCPTRHAFWSGFTASRQSALCFSATDPICPWAAFHDVADGNKRKHRWSKDKLRNTNRVGREEKLLFVRSFVSLPLSCVHLSNLTFKVYSTVKSTMICLHCKQLLTVSHVHTVCVFWTALYFRVFTVTDLHHLFICSFHQKTPQWLTLHTDKYISVFSKLKNKPHK